MGRTVLCPHCKSTINEDILKQKNSENICLVCGGRLDDDGDSMIDSSSIKQTFYYYDDGSATLTKTLYKHSIPKYTFKAVDMKDAERQLKEVLPNSPLLSNKTGQKYSAHIVSAQKCSLCQRNLAYSQAL